MRGRAHKAEIVLPAQRRDHVLGRKIGGTVLVFRAYEHERSDGEKTIPDRCIRFDLDQAGSAGICFHGTTFFTAYTIEITAINACFE